MQTLIGTPDHEGAGWQATMPIWAHMRWWEIQKVLSDKKASLVFGRS